MSARELESLILKRNSAALRWDNEPCNTPLTELSEYKIRRFVERAGLQERARALVGGQVLHLRQHRVHAGHLLAVHLYIAAAEFPEARQNLRMGWQQCQGEKRESGQTWQLDHERASGDGLFLQPSRAFSAPCSNGRRSTKERDTAIADG